jgi:hypothetical protein
MVVDEIPSEQRHETAVMSGGKEQRFSLERKLDLYKFYEETAEKYKEDAWKQATWILGLNGAIFAFSLNLYVNKPNVPYFIVIEILSAIMGIALNYFLFVRLIDLGEHIQGRWDYAEKTADSNLSLRQHMTILKGSKPKSQAPPDEILLRCVIMQTGVSVQKFS